MERLPKARTVEEASRAAISHGPMRQKNQVKLNLGAGAPGEARNADSGLLLSRQGPCGLPAVCAARPRPKPRLVSSANRVRPSFHCFQAMERSRRLIPWSSSRNSEGVWQKPK